MRVALQWLFFVYVALPHLRTSAIEVHESNALFGRRLAQLSTTISAISETQDNREIVDDPTTVPYNMIGLITAKSKDGKTLSSCTGSLIAKDYVLTAAHCLHDPVSGFDIASASFSPGYSTDLLTPAPFGSASMVQWTVPLAFVKCGAGAYTKCHQKNDFGIMKIDTSYNLWMAYGYDDLDAGNEIVNSAGYPGDQDDCLTANGDCVPYHVSCTDGVIQLDASFIDSQCFTFHGQSGSPVWLYYPEGDKRIIRGILASAPDTGGYGSFTLINSVVFNQLQDWMN